MTKRTLVALLAAILLLAACQPNYRIATVTPTPEPTATPLPPTPTPIPTEIPTEVPATPIAAAAPAGAALPLPIVANEFFATSGQCAVCHVNMKDEAANDVSLDRQWRSSMMANSGRDPYWQAGVRNEVLVNPAYADFIQDKCTTCHMPMARFTESVYTRQGRLLDGGFADPQDALHTLAMDGVSCTLCHQIEGANFGQPESFSGHYEIDTTLPTGQRHAYGPFEVTQANSLVMQGSSGFIPTQGLHVQESELCGTCHTLYTPTLNAAGEIVGEFAEQMVYPEWKHSRYSQTDSCVVCHLPAAEGGVVLSITGGELRQPFMQHIFVGANFYMPDLLRRYRDELLVSAGDDHFEATIALVMDQLQNSTATLALENLGLADGTLTAEVVISSQVGHKFPTSYPSRRAWLHVTIRNAAGNVIFESGAFNPDGSIAGNDNDADAARYEPHYTAITAPDQVQIYEAIMGDVDGLPTTTLLRGAGYLKDNRLLPEGFDKTTAPPDFQVWGDAAEDDDFIGGADRVLYAVPVGEAQGPFTIEAELLYQSIAYRWAHNLARHDSFETNRFLGYYTETPSPAGLVAAISATIP